MAEHAQLFRLGSPVCGNDRRPVVFVGGCADGRAMDIPGNVWRVVIPGKQEVPVAIGGVVKEIPGSTYRLERIACGVDRDIELMVADGVTVEWALRMLIVQYSLRGG